VVFDPEPMLAIDAIPCEDGHAQERSIGIARRGGSFVIRQHGSTLTWEAAFTGLAQRTPQNQVGPTLNT
jgi:hypothetical protein